MNTIQTTLPIKPTGLNPTEVPLGITGTLTETPVQQNIQPKVNQFTDPSKLIYLGFFNVSNEDAPGTKLYTWNYLKPLTDYYAAKWNTGDSQITQTVPWSLMRAFFSRQCRVDFELVFQPIKINDSRFSFDVVFSYDVNSLSDTLNTTLTFNDSIHKSMDSPSNELTFTIPTFFMTNSQPTDRVNYFYVDDEGIVQKLNTLPAFLPTTQVNLYVRNPYTPNNIQMETFKVLVYLRPIVTEMVGCTAKSYVSYNADRLTNNTALVQPWFMPIPDEF